MTQLQSLSIEVPQVKDGGIDCTFGSSLSIWVFLWHDRSVAEKQLNPSKNELFLDESAPMSKLFTLPKVIKPKTTLCRNHSQRRGLILEQRSHCTLWTQAGSSKSVWMIMIAEFSAMLQGITIRCHADFSLNDSLSKCEIGLLLWHPNTAPWHYSSKELPTE